MPYTKTTWVSNTTPLDAPEMNNLESQYGDAMASWNSDAWTPFILWGGACTKDGSINSQLDVAAGAYYPLQTDGTVCRRSIAATHYSTTVASTTYYLDANPDGTFSWGTAHSGQANYMPLCQVTTDSSADILVVTDERVFNTSFMSTMAAGGTITFPGSLTLQGSQLQFNGSTGYPILIEWSSASNEVYAQTPKTGAAQNGWLFGAWNGIAAVYPFSVGNPGYGSALIRADNLGTMHFASNYSVDTFGSGTGTAIAAPGAATLALASGTSLGIGVYDYKVTYTSAIGESALGASASVTTTTGNQDVNLSAIPTGPAGVTGRNIYRTKVGGSTYYLLHSIADNTTTTYSDTTADTSLSTTAPAHPTMGGEVWNNHSGSLVAAIYGDGAISFDSGNIFSDGAGDLSINGTLTFPTTTSGITATPSSSGWWGITFSGASQDTVIWRRNPGSSYAFELYDVTTSTSVFHSDVSGNFTTAGAITMSNIASSDSGNIFSDGSGHLTALAFHGPADSANSVAAANVAAGTLVSGVDLTSISSDGGTITSNGSGTLQAKILQAKPTASSDAIFIYTDTGTLTETLGDNGGGFYVYDQVNAGYALKGIQKGKNVMTTRSGALQANQIFTGTSTPSSPNTGDIWVDA